MANQFLSPKGDLEVYFVTDYWLIDQFIGDELWIWGQGISGQLGNNMVIAVSTPITTFAGGTNWKQVSSGGENTAAIKIDGTLWTWGGIDQLGTNDGVSRSTPVTTFAGGTNWKQVSSGNGHTAAIKTDGTLWTWGSGSSGRLGANNIITRSTPITTFAGGTNWKQVSCGDAHIAAIKIDGTLWTWGLGVSGQLGNNTTIARSTPVTTFAGGTNWKFVSCGGNNTAAIKTDGTLWTWGSNSNGQLGSNSLVSRSTPVTTFSGGTNWKQVSCGEDHTAAIKTNGTLWTWGAGAEGQLGDNTITDAFTPVTTFAGGTNWKSAYCGQNNTAALKTDGTLWVWGSNDRAKLGTNDGANRSTPVTTFSGGTNWKQVSLGTLNTSVVTSGIPADLPLS